MAKKRFYETEEGTKQKERLRQQAIIQFEQQGHPSLGRKHSDEAKEKMRKPRSSMKGDKNPSKRLEVRQKISESLRKRYQEQDHPSLGYKHSEATKEKIRASHKRRSSKKEGDKSISMYKNHKVKSIEKLSHKENCYDLTVPLYHNFALLKII